MAPKINLILGLVVSKIRFILIAGINVFEDYIYINRRD